MLSIHASITSREFRIPAVEYITKIWMEAESPVIPLQFSFYILTAFRQYTLASAHDEVKDCLNLWCRVPALMPHGKKWR